MDVFHRVFQAVPELEQQWGEIGEWVDSMTSLLGYYHRLAAELLKEEDTAKIPALLLPQGQREPLEYQANEMENWRSDAL